MGCVAPIGVIPGFSSASQGKGIRCCPFAQGQPTGNCAPNPTVCCGGRSTILLSRRASAQKNGGLVLRTSIIVFLAALSLVSPLALVRAQSEASATAPAASPQ